MTPERLQEIRRNKICDMGPLTSDVEELRDGYRELSKERRDLLDYIDLLHEDLSLTRAERDAEKKKRMADSKEIAALRRGQGTAPEPATPGTTPYHVTHAIPDSTGGQS